ncbi:MAG: hypothetical protein AAGK97_14855, partial [Bacteroidota bacterium]
ENIKSNNANDVIFSDLSHLVPDSDRTISDIQIDPNNPNKVWISYFGGNSNNKVNVSLNGGITWTDISKNLPPISIN